MCWRASTASPAVTTPQKLDQSYVITACTSFNDGILKASGLFGGYWQNLLAHIAIVAKDKELTDIKAKTKDRN